MSRGHTRGGGRKMGGGVGKHKRWEEGQRIAGEGTEKHTFTSIKKNFNYFPFLRKACGSKQLKCAV